jgi:hypothetical protein
MSTPRETLQGSGSGGLVSAPTVTPVQGTQAQQIAQLGDAIASTGVQGFRLSRDMQHDFDNAKYQEASARYAELLANEEAQFDHLTGEDAHTAFPKLQEKLHIKRNELDKNLTSETQRRAFGRDSSMRQTVALNRMNARRAEQLKIHRLGAASASLEQEMRDRVHSAIKGDAPDYIRKSAVMAFKLHQLAELNNLPEEVAELARETAESAVNTAIVEGLIETGAAGRAANFLEENGELIQDPVKREALKKRISTLNVKQRAESLVDVARGQGDLIKQRRFIRDLDESQEVKDELLRRARDLASEDLQQDGYRKTEALGRASELRLAGEPWPEALETELGELGILNQAKHMARNVTTDAGGHFMETVSGNQLLLFSTSESLIAAVGGELSDSDRRILAEMWRRTASTEMLRQNDIAEQKGQRNGSGTGQRSGFTAPGEKTVFDLDTNAVIDQYLTDHYENWRSADMAKLPIAMVNRRRSIRNAVALKADAIARSLGQTSPTNETINAAVREVLKVKTTTGLSAAGLSPQELEASTLIFDIEGKPQHLRVSTIGLPGEGPNESAKRRFTSTRAALIEAAMPELSAHLEGVPPDELRRIAEGLVSTQDVYKDLARQERFDAATAREAAPLLEAGRELSPDLRRRLGASASQGGPLQRETDAGQTMARNLWTGTLAFGLQDEDDDTSRDDIAFIKMWPKFRDLHSDHLRAMFPGVLGADDGALRDKMVELLFPDATPEQQRRLRFAANPIPHNAGPNLPRRGVNAEGLDRYLSENPEEIEFGYTLNGQRIQRTE